jgi:hypothetical protein
MEVQSFSGLGLVVEGAPEVVATYTGTVAAAQRRVGRCAEFRRPGPFPEQAARLVSEGFQGDVKKALVEMAPLRWDRTRNRLLLARRLRVRIEFTADSSARGSRRLKERRGPGETEVLRRLATKEEGLYAVRFEDLFGARRRSPLRASELRLSRQGEAVASPEPPVVCRLDSAL